MNHLQSISTIWKSRFSRNETVVEGNLPLSVPDTGSKEVRIQIEDYPAGYPRYSALISSYDPFFAFRSFRRLRARLLLLKQDELSILEEQFDQVDRLEASPLFLGQRRADRNTVRASIVSQIDSKLADYDASVDRCRQVLSYNYSNPKDITSLRNWVEGTGCLSVDETIYLEQEKDLISLASFGDLAMRHLEDWVETQLIRYYQGFREGAGFEVSRNKDIYIYSGSLIKRTATTLMLFLITSLLLTPVVICIFVGGILGKIFVTVISTACLLTVLFALTKSRMIELILAGAAFAAVIAVFVSNASHN